MKSRGNSDCRLSLCIVSWNCAPMLEACLASLEEECREQGFEIILVDNGSRDGSVQRVQNRFDQVQVLANDSNVGFTRAVNQALERAQGQHRLLLNPDTIVPKGSLSKALEQLEHSPEVGVLGCRVEYPDGRFQGSYFRFPDLFSMVLTGLFLPQLFPGSRFLNRERYGNVDAKEPRDVDCVMGGFFLIRGGALRETGLLDESFFMYAEEMDLAMRMKVHGWKVRWYPHPTIQHQRGGTSAGDPRVEAWCYGAKTRGQLLFLDKWRGRGTAWCANLLLLIFLLPRLPLWFLQDLAHGRPPWRSHKLLRGRILRHRWSCLWHPERLREAWALPTASP